jgi:hypothetical protein
LIPKILCKYGVACIEPTYGISICKKKPPGQNSFNLVQTILTML